MKKILLLLSIPCITSLASCDECIEGDDNIITEDRSKKIGVFTEIESDGKFDITIVQDTFNKIEVVGDDNILPYILTTKYGSKLIVEIESGKCYSSNEAIKINLRTKQIGYVKLNSSGIIKCRALDADKLELVLAGSGNIDFYNMNINELTAKNDGSGNILLNSGSANKSILNCNNSGNIDGIALKQKTAEATINGSGNIKVYFTESLNAKIFGSGNIYYSGDKDKVTIKDEGNGDVIDDN